MNHCTHQEFWFWGRGFFKTHDTCFIFLHVICTIKHQSCCERNVSSLRSDDHNTDSFPTSFHSFIKHNSPSGFQIWTFSKKRFITIFHFQIHYIFIRKIKSNGLISSTGWWARYSASTLLLIALWVCYSILYLNNNIYQRAILPVRAGFSKMYLIESIREINQVVWFNIYCLRRFATQDKAQQLFSNIE